MRTQTETLVVMIFSKDGREILTEGGRPILIEDDWNRRKEIIIGSAYSATGGKPMVSDIHILFPGLSYRSEQCLFLPVAVAMDVATPRDSYYRLPYDDYADGATGFLKDFLAAGHDAVTREFEFDELEFEGFPGHAISAFKRMRLNNRNAVREAYYSGRLYPSCVRNYGKITNEKVCKILDLRQKRVTVNLSEMMDPSATQS